MEEKKLGNQHVETCEKDLHFSDVEKDNHERVQHYGRDLLLQLRLHPLSLQKPKTLPGMEVIKEKLYLEDINETLGDKHTDINNYASMKSEFCNMKYEYPLVPHYFNRAYQYCYYPHGYKGGHHCTLTKFRPSYQTYCNTLKKNCLCNHHHHHYKDFPMDECLWARRVSSSEDMWSCYPSNVPPSLAKRNEAQVSVPKSKKKLSIIDPVTGENVLEAVTGSHHGKQNGGVQQNSESSESLYTVQQNSESSESYSPVSSEGKYAGDYFSNLEFKEGSTLQIPKNTYADSTVFPSDDKLCDKQKSSSVPNEDFLGKRFDDKPAFVMNNNKNDCASAKVEAAATIEPTKTQNVSESARIYEHMDVSDGPKLPNIGVHRMCQEQESIYADKNGNYQTHRMKECDIPFYKESVFKHADSMQESLKVKDKTHSLRQEQQKMAIYQGFLRLRKYQLEENARSLDEKRIEIATWERNLLGKAKKLLEKEIWLESKSEMLNNKAQKLVECENIFNREENKSLGDYLSSKAMSKNALFPEKKCADTVFYDNQTVESSYRNLVKNDFSYFEYASNPPKSLEDISLKYNSDVSSLGNLEEFVDKMHLPTNAQKANIENEEEASENVQKKAVGNSIGYSKGRRYLPENLKYWLNKQDKSAL